MNILLTSAGRRSYLVKYFKDVLGNQGEVHVVNSSSYSTAMKHGDKSTESPLIYSEEYMPFLLMYCAENDIEAIVSLFDIDLPILSSHVNEFAKIGVKVIVSSNDVITICNDKWLTFNYLKENGFHTPNTFIAISEVMHALENDLIQFPLMVKPRWGMGSIAVFEVCNVEELTILYNKTKTMIANSYLSFESEESKEECIVIQEKLIGQEYGLDIINDLEGNYRTTISKKKLAMRSGETDIAETVQNPKLEQLGQKLSQSLKHIANLDVDVFLVENKPFILEMNARFGGGYPFSHLAGVNLPKAIIKWLRKEEVKPSLLEARTGVIGYKDIEIIESGAKKIIVT